MNAELDDQHMTECQINQQALCDLCQSREVERNVIRQEVLTSQQTVETNILQFFQVLDEFTDVCTFCFVLDLKSEAYRDHSFQNCVKQQHQVRYYFSTLQKIRSEQLLITDSCCFTCFLPTVLCYRTRDTHNRCKYINVFFSIIVAAHSQFHLLNMSETLFSFDTTNCHKRFIYLALMLKKTRHFDTDAIVAVVFFFHIIQVCATERLRLQNEEAEEENV